MEFPGQIESSNDKRLLIVCQRWLQTIIHVSSALTQRVTLLHVIFIQADVTIVTIAWMTLSQFDFWYIIMIDCDAVNHRWLGVLQSKRAMWGERWRKWRKKVVTHKCINITTDANISVEKHVMKLIKVAAIVMNVGVFVFVCVSVSVWVVHQQSLSNNKDFQQKHSPSTRRCNRCLCG